MPSSPIQPWTILHSKVIHSTPWIEVVEDTCLVDGKEITYTYSRRIDEGPLIIAQENNGGLWLVRQYRHPIKKILWQFPAEGKHTDESWEAAAARGLHEELQRSAEHWTDLGVFYPDPGGLDQKYRAYLATGLTRIAPAYQHQSEQQIEHLEIACFSRKEIEQLINTGELADNWTLAGLYLLDRYADTLEGEK